MRTTAANAKANDSRSLVVEALLLVGGGAVLLVVVEAGRGGGQLQLRRRGGTLPPVTERLRAPTVRSGKEYRKLKQRRLSESCFVEGTFGLNTSSNEQQQKVGLR